MIIKISGAIDWEESKFVHSYMHEGGGSEVTWIKRAAFVVGD